MPALKNPILSRMLEVTGAANVTRLAARLGITPQTMQPYKAQDSVPESWLTTLQEKEGINPDYLRTGQGLAKIPRLPNGQNLDSIGRKFDTMIFHPNGQDRVLSDYPAAGIVTNASGLELPIGHMLEHILCVEVRAALSAEGEMELTGSGLALPAHRLDRLGIKHAGARTLRTADGLVVFDVTQTEQLFGAAYIIEFRGFLVCMRLEMGPAGAGFVPLSGGASSIPIVMGPDGPTPRIVGRAVWIGREL